jgi:hypothetical protein
MSNQSLREWCDIHGEPYGQDWMSFLEEEARNDGRVVDSTGLLSRQPKGSEVRILLIPPTIERQS